MAFDGAQFLRNPIRFDRMDTMMPGILDTPDAAAAPETGRLGGAAVVVQTDAAADLADSMEELSMQFEEKASKKLSDRRLGETRARSSAYIDALEGWMKTMPDMPGKDECDRLLRLLRQMAQEGGADMAALKGMLERLSGDPSHQFATLDILEAALGPEEGESRELVRTARESLMKEKGGEIRAGINLASEVNARATTPEEMNDLRNLYRSEVLGFRSPQDCFRSLLASRGAGGLEAAADFLFKGCGVDLASATPSLDPAELRRIMQDLQCVQVLKTVLGMMDALGTRMGREFGEKMLLGTEAMTSRIVDFTEKPYASSGQFAAFAAECGLMKLPARIDFTREITVVFRRLSSRLFSSEDDREKLIGCAQEHLDGLIAEEIDPDEGEEDRK